MRRTAALLLVLLLLGGGIAAAWTAGRLQAADVGPVEEEAPVPTVPVEERALRDTLSLPASLSRPVIGSVRGSGGTVTWMPEAGSPVREGDVVAEVDLRPVVALTGGRPMFRSLQWGAAGEDVHQLEAALERLGFDPGPVDGVYTGSTRSAWHDLAAARGYDVEGEVGAHDIVFVEGLPGQLDTTVSAAGEPAEGILADLVATTPVITAAVPSDAASRVTPGMPAMLRSPLLSDPIDSEVAEISARDDGAELLLRGDFDDVEPASLRVTVDLAGHHGEGMVVPVSALRSRADGSVYVRVVQPSGPDDLDVEVEVLASTGTEALVRGDVAAGDEVHVGD